MSLPLYAVYGVSGFGREVMPLAREIVRAAGVAIDRLVFIDDNPDAAVINGHQVYRYNEFLAMEASERHVVIAIANSAVREKLALRLQADGINEWAVRAANVVSMDEVELGEGALLCPFVTLTSNVRIGRQFHANIYSYVAHDCVIGDYVTFAPSVKCNGNIVIEDHAYIGTGAIIKQGTPDKPLVIGKGAIVGMGAVVTKDVPPGVTVVGNPAKPLVKAS
jgi:sugar O-acyltransferase (sialic acid O-acetyltransferase NeuD family)